MAVLTPIPGAAATPLAAPPVAGPACTLQRSGSLWQLGSEAQELTTTIGQLAEQLDADDDDTRAQALAELEAALLAEEHNKQALAAKADATCWVIEHLRGQAAYRQQQAKRLTELSRSDASRADALEDSLVLLLTRLQPKATRFSFPNHELTSRKSQAVEIDAVGSRSQCTCSGRSAHPDHGLDYTAISSGRREPGGPRCRDDPEPAQHLAGPPPAPPGEPHPGVPQAVRGARRSGDHRGSDQPEVSPRLDRGVSGVAPRGALC